MVGGFFTEMMTLLGKRTGGMHKALSSGSGNRDFAPEKFSTLYQRSVYQSIRSQVRQSIRLLEKHQRRLPKDVRQTASEIISAHQRFLRLAGNIVGKKIDALKIRIHGDYHLGQVLFTGKDFVIIDFEGEPARPISERRIKRSPLRDIAGMVRSFHYAAYSGLRKNPSIRAEDVPALEPWAELWYDYISAAFINGYREAGAEYTFIPKSEDDFGNLLQAFLLEKAAYEISYEINNRPDWVSIPLSGMKQILDASKIEQ
jgi:maltose alpha-D-glucosyltransferase/alpha-amylase